jgi:acyl-CoA hydrolase
MAPGSSPAGWGGGADGGNGVMSQMTNPATRKKPRMVTLDQLADAIRPGERIYVPGSAGEPAALVDRLFADPERTRRLDLLTSFIPGINVLPADRLHHSTRVTGLFMQPNLRQAHAAGRYRHLPLSYSGFVRHIADRVEVDTCLVQVSAPDAAGRCSLGPAVEFTPLVAAKSRRTVALVNARTPAMPGAASLPFDSFDLAAEVDAPLRIYDVGKPSLAAQRIAASIAGFVGDGAALQAGLGKVPEALFALLHDRRGLRLSSGMLADGALDLADAGALDPDFRHTTCVWVGSAELYRRLRDRPGLTVASCDVTHDIRRLADLDRFVAVNSALNVDLFGQANLELAEGRAVSGVGGAADFAPAARRSRGGLSIVALPSAYERNMKSRIVARLDGGLASLSRTEIDIVVTEHGVADLRGRCVHGRAEALIAIAGPAFRSSLADAWNDVSARL